MPWLSYARLSCQILHRLARVVFFILAYAYPLNAAAQTRVRKGTLRPASLGLCSSWCTFEELVHEIQQGAGSGGSKPVAASTSEMLLLQLRLGSVRSLRLATGLIKDIPAGKLGRSHSSALSLNSAASSDCKDVSILGLDPATQNPKPTSMIHSTWSLLPISRKPCGCGRLGFRQQQPCFQRGTYVVVLWECVHN